MIKFKPFGNNVLLRAKVVSEKTEAGVIKSQEMIKAEQAKLDDYYEILAVGKSVEEAGDIHVGDKVLLSGSAQKLVIDDIECLLVYAGNVLGKQL